MRSPSEGRDGPGPTYLDSTSASPLHPAARDALLAALDAGRGAGDPAARTDVPPWCRMTGQEYVGEGTAEDGTPAASCDA